MTDEDLVEKLCVHMPGIRRDLERVPQHMHGAVARYLLYGIRGGSFLDAVIHNNLVSAFGRADESNTLAMRDWANLLYNGFPGTAWGDRETVDAWVKSGGIIGQQEAIQKEKIA